MGKSGAHKNTPAIHCRAFTMLSMLLVLGLILAACTSRSPQTQPQQDIIVLAAASLTEPFTEIGQLFEQQHPGAKVRFNFAGSQQLAQQLVSGAPADVFASANPDQMQAAVQAGRILPDAPQIFAGNRLVVIIPADNPGGLQTLADLAKPGLQVVLAAKEVPVGQYTLSFLEKASHDPAFGADYSAAVLQNVVSYENNVKAVLTKVQLGEADAGHCLHY